MTAIPKPKPYLLVKRDRKAKQVAEDIRQRKLCYVRSGGRCEVIEQRAKPEASALIVQRCNRRVSQNHHLLGGVGRRNGRLSISAAHRLDVCRVHHQEIHAHILVPVHTDDAIWADRVRFERVQR